MIQKYTPEDWDRETKSAVSCNQHLDYLGGFNPFGSCNLECPFCHEVGFYSPRIEPFPLSSTGEITRKYRACKWCGFWQEAWGKVFDEIGGDYYFGAIFSHPKCGEGKSWGTVGKIPHQCKKCQENLINEGTIKNDPSGQKIKENMDKIHQNIPRITV